ncbi:hypothetical protein BH10PSE13_BH10PSE13_17040 [soil metagenome]
MREMGIARLSGLGLALIWSSDAMAQGMMEMPARDCKAQPATLPPEFAPWSARTPLVAALDKDGLRKATIAMGTAVDATLSQTADVRYALRPEKPGGSVSFGGMLAFDVSETGTYRVALGTAAWIDLLEDGMPVVSTSHGHGPDCSGVRKMVDFPLRPGRHVLQLAANPTGTVAVMVMRLP